MKSSLTKMVAHYVAVVFEIQLHYCDLLTYLCQDLIKLCQSLLLMGKDKMTLHPSTIFSISALRLRILETSVSESIPFSVESFVPTWRMTTEGSLFSKGFQYDLISSVDAPENGLNFTLFLI